MIIFLKTYFCLAVISFILRILCIGGDNYPRKISKGADLLSLIISLPFIIWVAVLVFK